VWSRVDECEFRRGGPGQKARRRVARRFERDARGASLDDLAERARHARYAHSVTVSKGAQDQREHVLAQAHHFCKKKEKYSFSVSGRMWPFKLRKKRASEKKTHFLSGKKFVFFSP
jgi:hypothetical protein